MGYKLEWDKTGTREFESGVSKVALFPMNDDGTYAKGVAWSGVTAINENPSGADVTDLYADDIKYASLRAAEKFGFTIEAFDYPDEWAACDGSVSPAAGIYVGQQSRKAFGLVYITKIGDDTHPGMDKGEKLHVIYNSTASPSGRNYATINENPDAISFSWEANSTPVADPNLKVENKVLKACSTITFDSTKITDQKWEALLNTVYGVAGGDGNVSGTDASLPEPSVLVGLAK